MIGKYPIQRNFGTEGIKHHSSIAPQPLARLAVSLKPHIGTMEGNAAITIQNKAKSMTASCVHTNRMANVTNSPQQSPDRALTLPKLTFRGRELVLTDLNAAGSAAQKTTKVACSAATLTQTMTTHSAAWKSVADSQTTTASYLVASSAALEAVKPTWTLDKDHTKAYRSR